MSTTPYVVSVTVDQVIVALGAFLQPFLPAGAQIVRAQTNRVAMPESPFVELTEILQVDLETPIVSGVVNAQVGITGPKRIEIQADFYGPSAGDYCAAVKGVYRTAYTVAQFPSNIVPLYCSEGHQMPLTTAEQQYETRWTLTCALQYNPVVTLPVQSADELAMNVLEDIL